MKTKLNSGGLNGNEKKYRALFDNAPIGISIVDRNRKILEANKALEKVISLSSEELSEELYKKRRYIRSDGTELPEDELPSTLCINNGTPVLDVEIGIEAGQKIIAWTQVSAAPVDLPEKCAVVITQDITQKKSLQRKLIDNEAKFRALFENSLDAFLISSPDGTIHSANPAACKMFGYNEVQLCKSRRSGLVDTSDPVTSRFITDRNKTGMFFGEITMIKNEGIKFPAEISSCIFTDSEGEKFTSTVIRDITERKNIEKALHESEEKYRLIYDNALEEIAKCNQAEKELFHRNNLLEKLNQFSMDLSKLSLEDNLEAFIARQLMIFTGASMVIFNEYNHLNSTLITRHIEGDARLLEKVASLLGKDVIGIQTVVSEENYRIMTTEIIGVMKSLSESSFGTIPQSVSATIQEFLNVDRFIGIAYIVEGSLYGTSLLAMDKRQSDPPKELLGNFVSLIGVSLRRKQVEEALEEREAEYRNLFENSIMGISQTYPDGRFKRINKAYAEMYGYPDTSTMMNELSSNAKMLYSHPEDRKKVIEILDKTGYMPPTEFELNRRDGEKFWALVGAKQVMDTAGKLLYLQAEHRDITSRKKMEKEMYSASLYARSLIEASLDPLVTINAEGKITDVNLATERVTGYKRGRLIGSEFADYFVESEKAREGYNIVFSKGVVKDYPLTIRHKNGRTTDVLYNATLFKNDKGVVQGVFAAARDITLRKKMEIKLQNSKKLLEKLNQHLNEIRENERSEIALNLHDDLGQRLTALYLDIAWVKSRIGVQSNPVRKKLEEMIREINGTIEGIKELSSFLRPTMLYDLGLVPAIISQLNKFEKQSGIKCYFYFDSEELNADKDISLIFYRIIQESLTNIVRHSGASAIDLNLKKLKNAIEMVIKDNGIGIDNEKVNSLTSMGLEGMRERVKSAHGEVSIEGDKGSGTTIIVTIPIKKRKI